MEGSRPQKLAKLHDLRRSVPYVSKSALEAILARVAEEGLPERRTTKAMLAAVRAELAHWCAYGELLMTSKVVDLEGMEQDMLHVNFHSLLHGAYKQGGSFTELLNACHSRCPSSLERPWSLCVYTDECWPGNALSAKAQKKSGHAMSVLSNWALCPFPMKTPGCHCFSRRLKLSMLFLRT